MIPNGVGGGVLRDSELVFGGRGGDGESKSSAMVRSKNNNPLTNTMLSNARMAYLRLFQLAQLGFIFGDRRDPYILYL